MANPEHLAILKEGVEVWNQWRKENPKIIPDLRMASLRRTNLSGIDFNGSDLIGADLRNVDLSRSTLIVTRLEGADLSGSNLSRANLLWTDLTKSNLSQADFIETTFNVAILNRANFKWAKLGFTSFVDVDLSEVLGLDVVRHRRPSYISIDTIYKSCGKIPASFLLDCGVPESFITQIPSLIGAIEPFQYHSCFISYSTKDEEFAQRLHSRLRAAKVRVWYSPEDVKGGEKLRDQIERAIQLHDRLLLVLSENSIQSGWVESEIRKALEVEKREGRRKLFPIRLVDFETVKKWKCFDADSGRDLAVEVREYFIPDFSHWKDHDSFEKGFERLLKDLKSEDTL